MNIHEPFHFAFNSIVFFDFVTNNLDSILRVVFVVIHVQYMHVSNEMETSSFNFSFSSLNLGRIVYHIQQYLELEQSY